MRIAMWSGPRNISTAMMRAWENRDDTAVVDEPLYAFYLQATGADHPMRDAVIDHGETDWRVVTEQLASAPIPNGRGVYYQKHMTHHLLPQLDLEWTDALLNCFLIREPRYVVASYAKKRAQIALDDLGFRQQAILFDHVCNTSGAVPPVVLASDLLEDPPRMLRLLCEQLEIGFSEQMLTWPPGRRASDGIWAAHWYESVEQSTGFSPYVERQVELSDELAAIARQCEPHFERLYEHRLRL